MKKVFVILFITFLVSSCAKMHRAGVATKAQTVLIGMSKSSLYECAGTPTRKEIVDGIEFLTYEGGGDLKYGYGSGYNMYCLATFKIKAGKILQVNYSGRTGGWASQGEQCAFIVENCVRPPYSVR